MEFYRIYKDLKLWLPAVCVLTLTLSGCASNKTVATKSASGVFTGGKWTIHEISGMVVDPSKAGKELPSLDFNMAEKKVNVFAGCNRMSAGFILSNDTIAFSQMISTRMACPHMEYEYALQRLLVPGNYIWKEQGEVLELFYNSVKVLDLKRSVKDQNK